MSASTAFDLAALLPADLPPLIDLRLINKYTSLSMPTLRAMVRAGTLPPAVRVNRRIHLLPTALVRKALTRLSKPEGVRG